MWGRLDHYMVYEWICVKTQVGTFAWQPKFLDYGFFYQWCAISKFQHFLALTVFTQGLLIPLEETRQIIASIYRLLKYKLRHLQHHQRREICKYSWYELFDHVVPQKPVTKYSTLIMKYGKTITPRVYVSFSLY